MCSIPRHTEHTVTDPDVLAGQLSAAAEEGYAVDDEEQEIGVRCVAVAVPDAPSKLAMSVSGPPTRVTDAFVEKAVPLLKEAAAALSSDLDTSSR